MGIHKLARSLVFGVSLSFALSTVSLADVQIGQIQSVSARVVDNPMRATGTSVIISIRASSRAEGLKLTIKPSKGFSSTPREVYLPSFEGTYEDTVEITPSGGKHLEGRAIVQVSGTAGGKPVSLATATLEFVYNPSISIRKYLLLGVLGVFSGWALRLLVNVLKSTPPPEPFLSNGGGSLGPITRLVERCYYVVDLGVTAALALFVMLAMITNGYPPVVASYWYGALGLGMGLGLLTNSELITRFKPAASELRGSKHDRRD